MSQSVCCPSPTMASMGDMVLLDALDTTVGARVVGAGGNIINAEAVVEGEGKFGAKPESVCRRVELRGIPGEGYIGRQGCRPCRRW